MIDMKLVLTHILNGDENALTDYLSEHTNEWMTHPDRATVEAYIAGDAEFAVEYASCIEDRFSAGELAIATDPGTAYQYAMDIIEGRWPEGETAIATNPWLAYDYALNIVKGRWPEAEPAIASDPWTAALYVKNILRHRWPEAEEVIMSNQIAANAYKRYLRK